MVLADADLSARFCSWPDSVHSGHVVMTQVQHRGTQWLGGKEGSIAICCVHIGEYGICCITSFIKDIFRDIQVS